MLAALFLFFSTLYPLASVLNCWIPVLAALSALPFLPPEVVPVVCQELLATLALLSALSSLLLAFPSPPGLPGSLLGPPGALLGPSWRPYGAS